MRRVRAGRLAVSAAGIVEQRPAPAARLAVGPHLRRLAGSGFGVAFRLAVVAGSLATAAANMPWRTPGEAGGDRIGAFAPRQAMPLPAAPSMPVSDARAEAASRPARARPDPQSLCDVMAGKEAVAAWAQSPLFPGRWECFVDFSESPDDGAEGQAGPIFAIIRGRDQGTVDEIRLKLSIAEGDDEPRWPRLMREMAASLVRTAGGTLPAPIEASLEALRPAHVVADGFEIVFSPERTFPGRYNLIIRLEAS